MGPGSTALIIWAVLSRTLLAIDTDKDVGTFWHFTDMHLDMSLVINSTAGYYGTYDDDTSKIVAFTGIEKGNDEGYAENAPDFVIWGGDTMPHKEDLNETVRRDALIYLSRHFRDAFKPKTIPLIPILGNYDVLPVNAMSPYDDDEVREKWCTELANDPDLWKSWIDGAQESSQGIIRNEANFSKNCFLMRVLPNNLVLVGLNSLVWSEDNPLVNETIADPLGQFEWLTSVLEWARSNGKKVLIAMHHPFGMADFQQKSTRFLKNAYNGELVQIHRMFSDVILTTLAGHEHLDTFRVILNETYYPIGTVFLGPSVNPRRLPQIGPTNPRIRKYYYHRSRGTILDYVQFRLNLSQEGPDWVIEYRATDVYKLSSLAPDEMARLLDQFTEKDDQDGRWTAYWHHQLGGCAHDAPSCPTARSRCRCLFVCATRHLDEIEAEKCEDICQGSTTPMLKTIDQLINPHVDPPKKKDNVGQIVGIVIGVLLAVALVCGIGYMVYRKRRGRD